MKQRIIYILLTALLAIPAYAQKKYPQPILAEHANIFGYAYDRDKHKLVIDYIYEEANEFDANVGQAIVKFKGHYAVIDPSGTAILEPIYDDIFFAADYQTYVVKINGKTGVLNIHGDQIIPIIYDNLGQGSGGWYEGELEGEWVYVHPDGRRTSDMSKYLKWRNADNK